MNTTATKPLRWYQSLTPYHWWVFCVGALAWLFDCTDQRIFMLARSPALSQLLNLPQTDRLVVDYATWATAATMAGWALGGLFFGVVGDRWGRVKTLAASILLYSLFTGLCGLATNWWDFCLYRLLMGSGIMGLVPLTGVVTPFLSYGGSAMLAARYALPDLGLAGFAEMLAGIRDIVDASQLPCLVDADDGYGDVKSVVRTIQGYEAAGVAGALLEDQSREVKQPGAASARSVVPLEIMEQKLKAAMGARRNPDFVIIGRTDAYGAEGLDAALKRAERFLRLEVDGIFVAGLKTPEDYVRVGNAFKGNWNCAAIFEAAATPWLTPAELVNMGFSQVAYPNILIGRVVKAMEQGLRRLGQLAAGKEGAVRIGQVGGGVVIFVEILSGKLEQGDPQLAKDVGGPIDLSSQVLSDAGAQGIDDQEAKGKQRAREPEEQAQVRWMFLHFRLLKKVLSKSHTASGMCSTCRPSA